MNSIQIINRFLLKLPFGKTTVLFLKSDSYYYHYGQCITNIHRFHSSSKLFNEQFKTEKSTDLLKKIQINDKKTQQASLIDAIIYPNTSLNTISTNKILINKHKTIRQRIVNELKHYYHGFKLLFTETKIAFHLLHKILNGHTLTRRERKQFIRTSVDLFRLVPFSIFIIVPFLEFTLPIFLKIFPNMLPSTFKQKDKEKEKFEKQSKLILEITQFLQDTLEDTTFKFNRRQFNDVLTIQLNEFMQKTRSTCIQPSIEEIIEFSSLFENNLPLNNFNRSQLIALCKLLNISFIGPNHYLRFKLHMKFYHLKIDDKLIVNEGIKNLHIEELQIACHERGINSFNVNIEQLQLKLQQWIDLHINKCIPITILLLSHIFYLSENISNTTVEILPKIIENMNTVEITNKQENIIKEKLVGISQTEFIKPICVCIKKEEKIDNINIDQSDSTSVEVHELQIIWFILFNQWIITKVIGNNLLYCGGGQSEVVTISTENPLLNDSNSYENTVSMETETTTYSEDIDRTETRVPLDNTSESGTSIQEENIHGTEIPVYSDDDEQEMNETESLLDDIIKLNVGGQEIMTLRSTLTAVPNSKLALIFTKNNKNETKFQNEQDKVYFFDYNPIQFQYLLDQLREIKRMPEISRYALNIVPPNVDIRFNFSYMLYDLGLNSNHFLSPLVGTHINLNISSLIGWKECYHGKYNIPFDDAVLTTICKGKRLLVACRSVDDKNTLIVAGIGKYEDIFPSCTSNSYCTTEIKNGTGFYYMQNQAWGFQGYPKGFVRTYNQNNYYSYFEDSQKLVYLNPCDSSDEYSQYRLCWSIRSTNGLGNGDRCGNTKILHNTKGWERLIYHAI